MLRIPSTERLARASASRPKLTLVAWLGAFLAAGVAIAMLLGSSLTTDDDFTNRPESKRAQQIIDAAFPVSQRRDVFDTDAVVVVHGRTDTSAEVFRAIAAICRSYRTGTHFFASATSASRPGEAASADTYAGDIRSEPKCVARQARSSDSS